ncbi:MAG: hypothetical protein LBQ75_05865 [Zoogloeaceae bacterium]|jgi:hypothetical protein|nr:hypothetical protein [Zoogloeaceae bacterium]
MKLSVNMTGLAALLVSLSLCLSTAQADDINVYRLPIEGAIRKGIDGNIKLYFGDQSYPEIEETLAKRHFAHRRSNFRESSDPSPYMAGSVSVSPNAKCNKAMLATTRELQKHARNIGGNAIINIESYHQNNQGFRSSNEFECYSTKGKLGVMLRGDIVRLKE